jgi:hypothetical protein
MVFPQILVEETIMYTQIPPQSSSSPHIPWNKGRLIGQKKPLKLKEIWAIRIRLLAQKSVGFRNKMLFLAESYLTALGDELF